MTFKMLFGKPETKAANAWKKKMEEREIEKNIFHTTGRLQESRAFAETAMEEITLPMQTPEVAIKPIVVFSRDLLTPMDFIKMAM